MKAVEKLGQSVHFHEPAIIAGTMPGGACHERLIREFTGEAVHHASLGQNDKGIGWIVLAEGDHFLGAADFVSHFPEQSQCIPGGQRQEREDIPERHRLDRLLGE